VYNLVVLFNTSAGVWITTNVLDFVIAEFLQKDEVAPRGQLFRVCLVWLLALDFAP
jgi:hypothetical protein